MPTDKEEPVTKMKRIREETIALYKEQGIVAYAGPFWGYVGISCGNAKRLLKRAMKSQKKGKK